MVREKSGGRSSGVPMEHIYIYIRLIASMFAKDGERCCFGCFVRFDCKRLSRAAIKYAQPSCLTRCLRFTPLEENNCLGGLPAFSLRRMKLRSIQLKDSRL
ncbi:hypothetical protein EGR_10438 [Echinococcus granulosus]|uniref:Uncharacterized protein n=1 Tax=Echinococcus granulosus TaxID=6210 RepID=W6U0X1_ECHGR|nr:hypothetical protein EGR_10438 [Echinococcus granulosus]EUB54698.1 hypothetical protein EGR_10438 [Echinococcus granulosus]